MKAAAVLALQMREVNHRVDDEVDRHQVEVPALHANQRNPARPGLPKLLQRLEEVVGAVDLVDRAGLRMPDDGTGPVDAEGHAAIGAHHRFGIVLGAVIRVIEVLGLFEHVLGERAAIETRRGDRAHEMEATGVDVMRERERVLGAGDVGAMHRLGAGLDVVDGAEMEEVRDLALELAQIPLADPESGLREVALDRDHAPGGFLSPELLEFVELAQRPSAHEDIDRAPAALQQRAYQVAADEPGRAGHEVTHVLLPRPARRRRPAPVFAPTIEAGPGQVNAE